MPSKPDKRGKLFSLKEFVTLDDAARYLSIALGDEVAVADVLQLAIEKRLKLSVHFVNHATASTGRLVPLEECTFMVCTSLEHKGRDGVPDVKNFNATFQDIQGLSEAIVQASQRGEVLIGPKQTHWDDDRFLLIEEKVQTLRGVWDLSMMGGEALDIEHRYQQETGGPAVTLTNLEGAFVEKDGVIAQLLEDFENNDFAAGSNASGDRIEARIAEDHLSAEQAAELREAHKNARADFLKRRRDSPKESSYFPAQSLPEDSVLVVRMQALRDFERSLDSQSEKPSRTTSTRETQSLLNIVGALVNLLLGTTPGGAKQSVFRSKAAIIEAILARHPALPGLTERTLQQKFADAKRSLEG